MNMDTEITSQSEEMKNTSMEVETTNDDDVPPPDLDVLRRAEFELDVKPKGRGTFGIVYKGTHKDLGHVAVKTLVTKAVLSEEDIGKLKNDANKIRKLCHYKKCFLSFTALIMDKSYYSIVTQYMPFGNLRQFRQEFMPEWPLYVRITKDILDAMIFLHSQNPPLLHPLLKAENVLINKQVRAKVTDFGLSAWHEVGEKAGSDSKQSPTRMPPEYWNDDAEPDKNFDVYSFGILLWEMLAGLQPFGNVPEEVMKTAVMSGQRPDFANIPRDAPPILSGIMNKAWAQNIKIRPSFEKLGVQIEKGLKNIEKKIPDACRKLRKEICRKYQPGELLFSETMELEMKEEVVETKTLSAKNEQSAMKKVEPVPKPQVPAHEVMKKDRFKRLLFDPISLQLAKSKYNTLNSIIAPHEEFHRVTKQPYEFLKGLEKDLSLRLQMHRYPFRIMQSMSEDYFTKIHYANSIEVQEVEYNAKTKSSSKPFSTYYGNKDDKIIAREKRRERIKQQVTKNHVIMQLFSGHSSDKVIRLLENPDILEDMAKGDYRNLQTMSPEVISLLHDPKLLISVLMADDKLREKVFSKQSKVLLQLLSNPEKSSRYRRSREEVSENPRRRRDMMRMGIPPSMMRDMDMDDMMMMQEMEMDRHMARREPRYRMDNSDDSEEEDGGGRKLGIIKKIKKLLPNSSTSSRPSHKVYESASKIKKDKSASEYSRREVEVPSSTTTCKSPSPPPPESRPVHTEMVTNSPIETEPSPVNPIPDSSQKVDAPDRSEENSFVSLNLDGINMDIPDISGTSGKRDHSEDSANSNNEPTSFLYENITHTPQSPLGGGPSISATRIKVDGVTNRVQYGQDQYMVIEPNETTVINKPARKKKRMLSFSGEDKAPTRKQLDMIASNIGYKWKEFLRELEFEESLIDQLHIDFKKSGTYEVVYQGLQKWVKRQGKSASLKFLFECLCKLDYEDIAEKLLT